jgi:hypothetical protein
VPLAVSEPAVGAAPRSSDTPASVDVNISNSSLHGGKVRCIFQNARRKSDSSFTADRSILILSFFYVRASCAYGPNITDVYYVYLFSILLA